MIITVKAERSSSFFIAAESAILAVDVEIPFSLADYDI